MIKLLYYCRSSTNTIFTNYTINAAASSFGVAASNDYCDNTGMLTISNVSPSVASLPVGDYYEYQLTSNTSPYPVVSPWQTSYIFTGLAAGSYRIQVRHYCTDIAGYSGVYTRPSTATISSGITSMSSAIVNEVCTGNGGSIAVTTVTPVQPLWGPNDFYEYQLTTSVSPFPVVMPWQTFDVFTNVPPGTYRIKARI